ncbi:hypothetical protein PU629_09325 [Pullulanibacillus sp. KACC 23026]|uniref:hypothetical protein n=1 Tax=Pullulanibacillus sp. KACC 23026 TaxID=3028315 RepID=UPI0023AF6328|nr:hypothetical protein [Pullulanibacillus sp. KACC 23026]WEG14537.1 hypothetical protein PU629_09325 [Pullulanibacillus sp. KACC 23026]
MSRVGKSVLWLIVGIIGLGFLFFCFSLWIAFFNGDQFFIKRDLNHLIHNPVEIQSVSKDTLTVDFFKNSSKDPNISDIEEELDHNKKVNHYKAKVNGKPVDLYVHVTGFYTFSITKISVDGLPNLPDFYMD